MFLVVLESCPEKKKARKKDSRAPRSGKVACVELQEKKIREKTKLG